MVRKRGGKVFCLEESEKDAVYQIKNSGQLLGHPKVLEFIQNKSKGQTPGILAFKPNLKIDILCSQYGFKKLINSSEINEKFENKINFFEITKKYFPDFHLKGTVGNLGDLNFKVMEKELSLPFVVQFGHGWAGKTTFFIKNELDWENLKEKFPQTLVKVTKYLNNSFTILNNCCIYKESVLVGPPAIQLSGIPELSENKFITCGRQWPAIDLSKEDENIINSVSEKVGLLMAKEGYRGFFGLDFLIDKNTGKIFLSENNARFTASTPFYTKLELGMQSIPLMIYHLASFFSLHIDISYNPHIVGSQIIVRKTSDTQHMLLNDLKTGKYKLNESNLEFLGEEYDPGELNQNEFIIIKEKENKKVQENEEIARIETKNSVLNKNYELKNDIKKLLAANEQSGKELSNQ